MYLYPLDEKYLNTNKCQHKTKNSVAENEKRRQVGIINTCMMECAMIAFLRHIFQKIGWDILKCRNRNKPRKFFIKIQFQYF
ncbi:MAG: hypothetical protein DRO76_00725 [Candidatus Altiarchaeales archaeon]|nr:MAG: hypothetical protein DRO76_00725 [Candidatus Altiarchaeales archaeon]